VTQLPHGGRAGHSLGHPPIRRGRRALDDSQHAGAERPRLGELQREGLSDLLEQPHARAGHDRGDAEAQLVESGALDRRSMVRMGPVVRATEDPPRSPPSSRHLTLPLTVPRELRRCRLAWRLPPTRSHGGSRGFKSPHLHPLYRQVRASPASLWRRSTAFWDHFGPLGPRSKGNTRPPWASVNMASRRSRSSRSWPSNRYRPDDVEAFIGEQRTAPA
jgi:hypothetical protein